VIAVDIAVRPTASPEEIAAVVAALASRGEARPSPYDQWRATRLAALTAVICPGGPQPQR
jgi:hypothetical protein